jgi:hypothetical protein
MIDISPHRPQTTHRSCDKGRSTLPRGGRGLQHPHTLCTLLCGSESWVLTRDLMRQLRSFHRRCCQGLARDFIRQDESSGEWICPNGDKVLQKAGMQTIQEHTQRRRDTIMECAKTRNVCEKCKNLETAGKHLLWLETDCHGDDAAEAPWARARPSIKITVHTSSSHAPQGAEPKTMAVFCRVAMAAPCTPLCGSESWVSTKDLMQQLRSFHRQCCQGLARDFL